MLRKFKDKLFGKKVGIDGFVVAVIIILIALVLGVLFRDELTTYVKGMFQLLTGKSTTLLG